MTALIQDSQEYNAIKEEIANTLGVKSTSTLDPFSEIRSRIDYLKNYLKQTGLHGYVLGISGGVDSTTVGRLCQLAVEELRAEGYKAKFVAVRLPAGIQKDEADAQTAIKFINADELNTVNVGEAATNLSLQGVSQVTHRELSDFEVDFAKGNIKARLRMVAQYQLAALHGCLVIGTDHNSEAAMGFYTKFGDGACDLTVLNGLNKRQVRLLAKTLGAPAALYEKAPTADLEELNEGKLDDEGFGFPYYKLDDFLEGLEIDAETEYKIVKQYHITQHKRKLPVSF
jgi:NAD+ synthase